MSMNLAAMSVNPPPASDHGIPVTAMPRFSAMIAHGKFQAE